MKYVKLLHGILRPISCAALMVLFLPFQSQGHESLDHQLEGGTKVVHPEEHLAVYKGDGAFSLGFRFVDVDSLSRVAEYEDEDSSLTFDIEGTACPLPHRYHIHSEYLSENSYYGDLGYAYKDLLLFRDLFVGVHHNLDHYNYQYPSLSSTTTYEDRSIAEENYIDFYKNDLLLRLKAPNYPFHGFLKSRYITREGGIEERFMTGSIGRIVKTSQTRNIDWDSQNIALGLNSHLGPVEVEYQYETADFDPGPDSVLYDYYPGSFFGRPADVYGHNVIPETESFTNSLKFHSSYTGQIVASATFSNASNKNNYSASEAEIWKAAFDLRWIPEPRMSLSFKYRHNEIDKDNPDVVEVNGLVHSQTHSVRPLISIRSDLFSLAARYRPLGMLTLIGKYELELLERSDVDEWVVVPEDSEVHRINLTAHARPLDKLKLKGIYDYIAFSNPAYNTEPDDTNKLRLNATYTPLTWLTALVDYTFTMTNRDQLRYYSARERELNEQGEREGIRNHILTSLSFVLSPDATVTVAWDYNRWKIEQDLAHAYWGSADTPYYDLGVPYEDESNTLTLSLYYQLRKDLSLTADLAYVKAQGEYQSGVTAEDGETSLGSFSEINYEETVISAELAKKILANWEIGLKTRFGFYDDELIYTGPDHQDGELYITTLMLKRYF